MLGFDPGRCGGCVLILLFKETIKGCKWTLSANNALVLEESIVAIEVLVEDQPECVYWCYRGVQVGVLTITSGACSGRIDPCGLCSNGSWWKVVSIEDPQTVRFINTKGFIVHGGTMIALNDYQRVWIGFFDQGVNDIDESGIKIT